MWFQEVGTVSLHSVTTLRTGGVLLLLFYHTSRASMVRIVDMPPRGRCSQAGGCYTARDREEGCGSPQFPTGDAIDWKLV